MANANKRKPPQRKWDNFIQINKQPEKKEVKERKKNVEVCLATLNQISVVFFTVCLFNTRELFLTASGYKPRLVAGVDCQLLVAG